MDLIEAPFQISDSGIHATQKYDAKDLARWTKENIQLFQLKVHSPHGEPWAFHCEHCRRRFTIRLPWRSIVMWLQDRYEYDFCSKHCAALSCQDVTPFPPELEAYLIRSFALFWKGFPVVGELDVIPMQHWWWRQQRHICRQHIFDRNHPAYAELSSISSIVLTCFAGRVFLFPTPDQAGVWTVIVRNFRGFQHVHYHAIRHIEIVE